MIHPAQHFASCTLHVSYINRVTTHSPKQHCSFLCSVVLYIIRLYFHHQTHPQLGIFTLWLSLFLPFGPIPPLFSISILGTYQLGDFIFQGHIFLPFHTVHEVFKARRLKWFSVPIPVVHVLSELSTMTCPFMVLHGMTHNCSELDKAVIHVISCSVIVVFIVCPLIDEDKRLVEASAWEGLSVGKTVLLWWARPCSVNL